MSAGNVLNARLRPSPRLAAALQQGIPIPGPAGPQGEPGPAGPAGPEGPQTPWSQDVDADGYDLMNAGTVEVQGELLLTNVPLTASGARVWVDAHGFLRVGAGTERFTDTAANAAVNGMAALLNGGSLRIYSGTQPATASTAITGQVLLAEPRFGSPAFAPATGGIATANAITPGSGLANGQATWFRAVKSDATPLFDGSVSTAGADLVLDDDQIATGLPVSIESFALTQAKVAPYA